MCGITLLNHNPTALKLYFFGLSVPTSSEYSLGVFREISGNSEIRETRENVGKFSPGKFREIFLRIFLHFPGMTLLLQP